MKRTAGITRNALGEHKPPPIRRIWISDFGLPHPKRDPDRHQNCITWSLSHAVPLQKISSKSVHKFASNPTDRQTDRQTDKQTAPKTYTFFFGGGNKFTDEITSVTVHPTMDASSAAADYVGRMNSVMLNSGSTSVNRIVSTRRVYAEPSTPHLMGD